MIRKSLCPSVHEVTNSRSITEDYLEPDATRLSASAVAKLFDVSQQELAEFAGVHVDTLRTHHESAQLQGVLRELKCLIIVTARVWPDLHRSVGLTKGASITAFNVKTFDATGWCLPHG